MRMIRFGVVSSVLAAGVAFGASSATAAVTVGQIAPPNPPNTCSGGLSDIAQPTVTSGNSYVVKGDGTITSWSTSAQTGAGQMFKLKVWRKVGDPNRFEAVGQDIFRPLASGVVNSFAVNIPVKAGYFLGNNRQGSVNCVFSAPGDEFFVSPLTDLANGASDEFSSSDGFRANISAVVEPSNAFTLGAVQKNKKKGTATLTVSVPGPGDLTLSGKGVKAAGASKAQAVTAKGPTTILIRSKGKKKAKLLDTGKVKLNVGVTYTPTGGAAATQPTKVKLKKKL